MKKKSKFQQKLDEIAENRRTGSEEIPTRQVKLHKNQPKGDPPSQTAYPWIPLTKEIPPYYTNIDLLDEYTTKVYKRWHRVSDGTRDHYCNNNNHRTLSNPTHWRKRKGIKYNKYEPMTGDDIKQFTTNDINSLLEEMIEDRIPYKNVPVDTQNTHLIYNTGVNSCIKMVKRMIRQKGRK